MAIKMLTVQNLLGHLLGHRLCHQVTYFLVRILLDQTYYLVYALFSMFIINRMYSTAMKLRLLLRCNCSFLFGLSSIGLLQYVYVRARCNHRHASER